MYAFVLAIIILIFITVFRLQSTIKKSKQDFIEFGIQEENYHLLRAMLWLYLAPVLVLKFPFSGLPFLLPFTSLLILPGLVISQDMGKTLSTCGIDTGVKAGRHAENIYFLGIAILLFVLIHWGLGYLILVGS